MGSEISEISLPEFLQLETVSELHESLAEQHSNTVILDGSQVSKIDTSGLQLLISIKKELNQASGTLKWKAISEQLTQAIQTMGLGDELAIESK